MLNNNIFKIVDGCLISLGLAFGLSEIETILGIIILSVELVWIITKFVIKIYSKVKSESIEGIPDDIKELEEDLTNVREEIKKRDE